MQLSNKTAQNFENITHFTNSLKQNLIQLKKISTKNIYD